MHDTNDSKNTTTTTTTKTTGPARATAIAITATGLLLASPACALEAEPREPAPAATDAEVPELFVEVSCEDVRRIAGPNRFATAVQFADAYFPDATTFVLVGGQGTIVDAIAAGPLAALYDAPILPTAHDRLSNEVEAVLGEGDHVIVVGGTSAVSDAVVDELRGLGAQVERVAGDGREATAAAVARRFGDLDTVLVASGTNGTFADALVGAAAGAWLGVPVLLTNKDNVPAPTQAILGEIQPSETIIIGGTGVIDDATFAALSGTRRISGPSRYATAAAVIAELGGNTSEVLIAGPDPRPEIKDPSVDAVVASAVGLPLVYADFNSIDPASQSVLATADRATIVGGTAVLNADVKLEACEIISPPEPPQLSSSTEGFLSWDGKPADHGPYEYGPTVVSDGGRHHMWYCAESPDNPPDAPRTNWDLIRYTYSDDGHQWASPKQALKPDGPYFDTAVCDPSVVKHKGKWFMYTTCLDLAAPDYKNNRICAATADQPEGPWTPRGEVYTDHTCPDEPKDGDPPPYCVGQPTALVVDGEVRLYVTNRQGNQPGPSKGDLELLTSADGLVFEEPVTVFEHANADIKRDAESGYYLMVYGEVGENSEHDRELYWNLSANGRDWPDHDDARRLQTHQHSWDGANHNPGLAGDATGTFSGQTWATYGSSPAKEIVGDSWGKWRLYRSEVVLSTP